MSFWALSDVPCLTFHRQTKKSPRLATQSLQSLVLEGLKMADDESPSAEITENNQQKPTENGTDDIQIDEMTGWLMKRTKITHKWLKTWFHLKNTELYYGKSAEVRIHFSFLHSYHTIPRVRRLFFMSPNTRVLTLTI